MRNFIVRIRINTNKNIDSQKTVISIGVIMMNHQRHRIFERKSEEYYALFYLSKNLRELKRKKNRRIYSPFFTDQVLQFFIFYFFERIISFSYFLFVRATEDGEICARVTSFLGIFPRKQQPKEGSHGDRSILIIPLIDILTRTR